MIVWIDGTFGVGKTTAANELKKRHSEYDVVDFDELIRNVEPENPMELFFGKRYPESKKCYVDALANKLEIKLEQNDDRVIVIPIALITDYCKTRLVEHFTNITQTAHFILYLTRDSLLERINKQEGRNKDLAITYYDEATLYLKENYRNAIRINTDDLTISEVVCCIEESITNRR